MKISYTDTATPYAQQIDFLVDVLDGEKGMYLASGTDCPERYCRWDMGFSCPPVEVTGHASYVEFRALNARGQKMIEVFAAIFAARPDEAFRVTKGQGALRCDILPATRVFAEEERSRQPSPLSPLRHLIDAAASGEGFAGFYGAFKYDLLFSFNPAPLRHARGRDASLFRLYMPDRIYVVDRRKETVVRRDFEFSFEGLTTAGLPIADEKRVSPTDDPCAPAKISSDMTDAEYSAMVLKAKEHIAKGDVFEVVLSRKFHAPCKNKGSTLFRNLRKINPSPYEFYMQFGDEQLVGASPEMYVRVEGRRVESCPIAGTARRSKTPGQAGVLEDADILRNLLNSRKDEAELTMCTDVDRNDKARICVPGSVRLLGRRLIEAYTGLYHTVDYVEGMLRDDCDGIDAFLSHMWTVTLTGAPKAEAVRIVENLEPDVREYYGAAVGVLQFNGGVNSGTTIRTLHLKDGMATYRVGASLVYDSVPEEEAAETHTKANSFGRILSGDIVRPAARVTEKTGAGKTVVLIDNEDSFVQTLADYIRQTGANAVTFRHGTDFAEIAARNPSLVLHSPGPGTPSQFCVPETVRHFAKAGIPQLGVCLGLQGMFEAFGGKLGYLNKPHHGKTWTLSHAGHKLFEGVPSPCDVGAYHSIYGLRDTLPADLEVIGTNENDVIMAIAHKTLPAWAVQFHPESVLSMRGDAGMRMIENVMRYLAS